MGPKRTSGETKKAFRTETQLKLVKVLVESPIAVSGACLILTVLAGAW